jgi:hypothetical protein
MIIFAHIKRKFTVKYYEFDAYVWKLEPLPNPHDGNQRLKHLLVTQPDAMNTLCLFIEFKSVKSLHIKRGGL